MNFMEKYAVLFIMALAAIVAGTIVSLDAADNKQETKRVLKEINNIMELTLLEDWEIDNEKSSSRPVGDSYSGEVFINFGDCSSISVHIANSDSAKSAEDDIQSLYGYSHGNWVLEEKLLIDTRIAYKGYWKDDKGYVCATFLTYDDWEIGIVLRSDYKLNRDDKDNYKLFLESIKFK